MKAWQPWQICIFDLNHLFSHLFTVPFIVLTPLITKPLSRLKAGQGDVVRRPERPKQARILNNTSLGGLKDQTGDQWNPVVLGC